MAVFPCDFSAHRYPGPQLSIYVTSVWGTDTETSKLRLCQRHFDELVRIANEHMSLVDDDSKVGTTCETCGKDKTAAIYAKFFPREAEPFYMVVDCCAACWQGVRQALKVSNGSLLAAL